MKQLFIHCFQFFGFILLLHSQSRIFMTNPFRFKQFTIHQQQSAMKVGTDGVLLGAWADLQRAKKILDIGTGTGLLAIMAAQRNKKAQITGIDIDKPAVLEARENADRSPWAHRMQFKHCSLQAFVEKTDEQFDYIICNPPFFKQTATKMSLQRLSARQQEQLSIEELVSGISRLLSDEGKAALIYPFSQRKKLLDTLAMNHCFPEKSCAVKPTNRKPPKRLLIVFTKKRDVRPPMHELVIEPERRHEYSKEFNRLTAPFYL